MFCFFRGRFDRTTNFLGDLFGLLDRLDAPPFVGRWFFRKPVDRSAGKGLAREIRHCRRDPAWCFRQNLVRRFTFAARDIVSVANSEFFQIGERDRQLAVVSAAMAGELDLDAVENATTGQTEHAMRASAASRSGAAQIVR